MKEKIAKWLLDKIYNDSGLDKDTLLNKVGELIEKLAPLYLDNSLEKDIYKMIFDSTYKNEVEGQTPYSLLNTFYEKANKGDNSFMRDPFYRFLRRNKDKQVRNLKYRLKRNEN